MKRRNFVKTASAAILGGLAFQGNIFSAKASAPAKPAYVPKKASSSLPRKAKSIILVYLDGGPAQTDMFDPKPLAGRDYFGSYKQPLDTNVEGMSLGEKLPLLAKMTDKYSIIRSMVHHVFAHETAHYAMMTGDLSGGGTIVYPAFGAVISHELEKYYKSDLPAYISVTSASSRFNEAGFLGPKYKSFDTGGEPESSVFNVEGIVNHDVSDNELKKKRQLLQELDATCDIESVDAIKQTENFRKQNYSLILGESRKVFDLSEESKEVRDRYGNNRFGQSCLLARRLVEKGVQVVNVRYSGWDTHKEHFKRMDERLGTLDQGLSALLEDLSEKGLLDQTIILCGGEFGRTPKIMWEPPWNGGRGHYGDAFSYLVAGGGFSGGKVIGATDPKGEKVVDRPVYPYDLIGSVYQLMGIDPYGTLTHPRLGEIPILPSLKNRTTKGGLLTELMA